LIDVRLVPEIRAFEIEISDGGQATAVIDIALKVMNDANGRILASQNFAATMPAASDSAEDGVEALNAAFDALSREMVKFVLDAV
jgi:cholesterol transport system auxiliary component